ncbi:MAG: hypothetical protein ACSHX0_04600 [Akkermansiaceae bacterium]
MHILFSLTATLLMAGTSLVMAADAPALLLNKDGSNNDVMIIDYQKGTLLHHLSENDLNKLKTSLSDLDGVYFYEPAVFTEAMKLFAMRDYSKAKKMFVKCESDYKAVDAIKGNYSTLAGFYKLECSRLMFDFESLANDQKKFKSDNLVLDYQLKQLELNNMWKTVHIKDWAKLAELASSWDIKTLTGSQIVQVAYFRALSLEKTSGSDSTNLPEIMSSYNTVLTADFASSAELIVKAIENMLNIYSQDGDVQTAIKAWDDKGVKKGLIGSAKLQDANALVRFYKLGGFDQIAPLSSKLAKFSAYEVEKPKVEETIEETPSEDPVAKPDTPVKKARKKKNQNK